MNDEPSDHKPSMKRQAIIGSVWALGGYGASQVLRLGGNLLLAYLLFPKAFGLMGLVAIVMQGLEMFSDVGIGPSIVQNKRGDEPAFLNTAWTIQVIRGFALWICACILAWPASRFYGESDLFLLLLVASFSAVIRGLGSTSIASLNRAIKLREISLLDLVAQACALLVTAVWALTYPTVWALVGGQLAAALVKSIASHTVLRHNRDRFAWDRTAAQELFHFGKWIFISTIVTFIALHSDRLILGKLLTIEDFGLYTIALVLSRTAMIVASRIANTVLFPILTRHQDDPKQLMSIFIRARAVMLWASIGVCGAIVVLAPTFFTLFYKPEYAGSGLIAQWLVLFMWTTILLTGMDRVPLAMGKSRVMFQANIIRALGAGIAVGGYLVGEYLERQYLWTEAGLPGFIIGLSLGVVIAYIYLQFKLPHGRTKVFLQSTRYSFGLALFTGAGLTVLHLLRVRISSDTAHIVAFLLAGGICAIVLFRIVHTLFPNMKKGLLNSTTPFQEHGR